MRNFTLRQMLVGIAFLGCFLAVIVWLSNAMNGVRSVARASQCSGNFCQIALAIANYESQWGALPPAYTVDASGKPLLSWRVLILPQLEQQTLYARFNLSEPWDGPNNIKLISEMPHIYACPNHRPDFRDPDFRKYPFTSIVAVTGPRTAFPGATPRKLDEITDDRAQTLVLVEVSNSDIPWSAPVDVDARGLSMSSSTRPGPSSYDRAGINAVFGNLRYGPRLPRDLTNEHLRALSTIDGGEHVDWPPQPRQE